MLKDDTEDEDSLLGSITGINDELQIDQINQIFAENERQLANYEKQPIHQIPNEKKFSIDQFEAIDGVLKDALKSSAVSSDPLCYPGKQTSARASERSSKKRNYDAYLNQSPMIEEDKENVNILENKKLVDLDCNTWTRHTFFMTPQVVCLGKNCRLDILFCNALGSPGTVINTLTATSYCSA